MRGKQRSYLKGLANTLRPSLVIGKLGVNDNTLKELDDQLSANELVKIRFLDTNGLDPNEVAHDLCEELGAEFVSQLGSKAVLYRPAEEPKINLPTDDNE